MGNHIQKLFSSITKNQDVRLAMLGLDSSGKTTMLFKLKLGEIVTTIPTIGMNIEQVEYKKLHMTSWDVGGRDKIRSLWRHFLQGAGGIDGLIFMVDSNDRDRISDAARELGRLLSDDSMIPAGCPLLVIANKQDLPNAMSLSEITDKMGLHAVKDRTWFVSAAVAITGEGLYEGLDWLTNTIADRTARTAIGDYFGGQRGASTNENKAN